MLEEGNPKYGRENERPEPKNKMGKLKHILFYPDVWSPLSLYEISSQEWRAEGRRARPSGSNNESPLAFYENTSALHERWTGSGQD